MKLKSLICLSLLLISSASGISAYDFKVDGICYNVITTDDGEKAAEVTHDEDWNYYSGDIVIPETVEYDGQTLSVVSIGFAAFRAYVSVVPIDEDVEVGSDETENKYGHDLTSVTIPNSVKVIGDAAFYYCDGLTSIHLGENVEDIRSWAFYRCKALTEIVLPSSVRHIGHTAFEDCISLSSLILNEGLTHIEYAFDNCISLTSITIPSTVREVSYSLFRSCPNLTSATILTPVCLGWFQGNQHIKEVTLGEGVTHITKSAFNGCINLETINVQNDQCIIGQNAFKGTAWMEAQPDGVIYVGRCLYLYKGALPKGSTVEVREGTVAISSSAFQDCTNLKNILIPNSVTTIGESAFNSTGLESIILPEKLDTLEQRMFCKCTNLTSVRLPDHLSSIAGEVFKYCSALESVVIPASVTSIGGMAFFMMDKIKSVTSLSDTPCTVSAYVFSKISKNAVTLYIPSGTKDAYIAAGWDKGFSQIVEKDHDELETGIHSPSLNSNPSAQSLFDLSGRRLSVSSNTSVGSVLPKGVYIENGKKRVRN